MFPFKTKEFLIHTELTAAQLKEKLKRNVSKRKLIQISKDGEFYGTINDSRATIEPGKNFLRNSFRPVVVFKWTENNSKTEIKGYYRVALSVLIVTLLIPVSGLFLTIQINNILPFIFLSSTWAIIYMTFGRWLFYIEFKWAEEEFLKLVSK